MKEWGFEKFLEQCDIEDMMDDLVAEMQEKMVILLRKAYISGYDNGIQLAAQQYQEYSE